MKGCSNGRSCVRRAVNTEWMEQAAHAECHTYVYELYPINQRNRASCNRGGHSIMIVRVYGLMVANLKLISRLIITVPRWTLRSRWHTLLGFRFSSDERRLPLLSPPFLRFILVFLFLPLTVIVRLSLLLPCPLPVDDFGLRPPLAHVRILAFLLLSPSIFPTESLDLSLSTSRSSQRDLLKDLCLTTECAMNYINFAFSATLMYRSELIIARVPARIYSVT